MGKDLERFTSTLPDYLHCSICLDAAYPPYTTCSEQHLACATCAAELSVQEERPLLCPTCRRSASGHLRSAPGMKRALESYGYECEHLQCTWVGTVDEEPKHAAVQKYRFNTTKEHQACPRGGQNCGGYLNGGVTTRQQAPMHARLCSNHKRVMLSMFFSDDSDPDECDFDDSESEVDFLGEPMPKKIKLADPEPASA
ncbi:hypothetical protein Rhopal_000711-T1 [Rhodotorula paludigena]|uniref:RING-type domain-containing protein n=1 Tax=Rhodotorula paludigena TaxID=86838 RepID=A0AAV5G5F3_9BASI|nr:hypothetical protein Rhopal_000711-T1 [Rhodotorula paludigena]